MLIGLALHPRHPHQPEGFGVYAAATHNGKTIWRGEATTEDAAILETEITRLLNQIPRQSWQFWNRLTVHAVVGSPYATAKLIRGVPAISTTNSRSADKGGARFLRENASKFFITSGQPKITTGLRLMGDGTAIAARIDADVVTAIRNACQAAGVRCARIAPSPDTISQALGGDTSEPIDPYSHALSAVRSPANAEPRVPNTTPVIPTWRITAAATAIVTIGLFALLAPTLALKSQISRDQARLAELAAARRDAIVAERELVQLRSSVNGIQKFDSERTSTLLLLSRVTRVIPPDAALATLRYENGKVDVVVLAKRATAATGPLNGSIIGPVTREMVGTQELERATITFAATPTPAVPDNQ